MPKRLIMRKFIICCLVTLIISSCKEKQENDFFNGDITDIEFPEAIPLTSHELELDSAYTGSMYVFDSLLFFSSDRYPDYFMAVFDKNSGKQIGTLFPKGEGPGEYFCNVNFSNQFLQNEDGCLCMWIYDNNQSYRLINISRSLETKKTEVDSIIPYEYRKHFRFPFISTHIGPNKDIICGIQCLELFENSEYKPKYYALYQGGFDEPIQEYTLYKKAIPTSPNNTQIGMGDHYDSYDIVHPSGAKVALAMCMIGQINLLDTSTENFRGYHIKGTPTLAEASRQVEYTAYFTHIAADDQWIYALTANGIKERFPALSNTILVMDWEGKPIKKLLLDKELVSFSLDTKNNTIYGIDINEKIHFYNLSNNEQKKR